MLRLAGPVMDPKTQTLLVDVPIGLIAGLVATAVYGVVQQATHRAMPKHARRQESKPVLLLRLRSPLRRVLKALATVGMSAFWSSRSLSQRPRWAQSRKSAFRPEAKVRVRRRMNVREAVSARVRPPRSHADQAQALSAGQKLLDDRKAFTAGADALGSHYARTDGLGEAVQILKGWGRCYLRSVQVSVRTVRKAPKV